MTFCAYFAKCFAQQHVHKVQSVQKDFSRFYEANAWVKIMEDSVRSFRQIRQTAQ